ncbi:hypothetical protein BGZ94_001901 [Podila epigama]|nr:hypothetical protein BGZ94_001901 [Podila epigama]
MSSATAVAQQAQAAGENVMSAAARKTNTIWHKVTSNKMMQSYIMPAARGTKSYYDRSPFVVRATILALVVLSAIPVACFLGFMGFVTAGCLVVGGIAFTIVEGGFATFASAFLIPTLGVTALMAFGVGMTVLVARTCYKMLMYGVGFFKSPDLKATAEARTKESIQTVVDAAARTATGK